MLSIQEARDRVVGQVESASLVLIGEKCQILQYVRWFVRQTHSNRCGRIDLTKWDSTTALDSHWRVPTPTRHNALQP